MGIFDDAIREHLELKRHSGADEEELKELEDEAFGPPARPGEPDFPGTSEEPAVEAEAEPAGAGVFDAETVESRTPSDAVIDAPPEEEPALTQIEEEGPLPGAEAPPSEPEPEPAVADEPAAEAEPAASEEGRAESETPRTDEAAEASSFTTEEREAIADQPTVFFEQQAPAELELGDLELDLDEEIEEVGGSVSGPLSEDEPLGVEETLSDPAAETEVAEPPHQAEPEPEPVETELDPEAPAEPGDEAEGAEPVTSDEDVLEETPEFLRDNPDDDELWFEQGEPKDFDF